jgi:aminopeptidase-like protein
MGWTVRRAHSGNPGLRLIDNRYVRSGGPTADAGSWMHALVRELYPLCRSITGEGLRQTLRRIQQDIPIELVEVPTDTQVFDWKVPREWNIRDAFIKNSRGERVVDFQSSNLHVVSYSVPVNARMSLQDLKPHLHSSPERPDWIPYRTSYYSESWGFCLTHRQLEALTDDYYDVCIDATLEAGSLTYGELLIPGQSDEEVLISSHCCHPSLANDNLAGNAVAVQLAQELLGGSNRYTYRFVFVPATIGAITWLARNPEAADRVKHGLVLACAGDAGNSSYKRSRQGNALIDRAVEHVLRHAGSEYQVRDFVPYGYDERQYCSPGFNLAVGCLMRTPNGQFDEYHTSADNPDFVTAEALEDTLEKCRRIVDVLEHDRRYLNLLPFCEPQLGRRGLYQGIGSGGLTELPGYDLALLWVLNLSDESQSLFEIAERAGLPFQVVRHAADRLHQAGLLKELGSIRARGAHTPPELHLSA